MHIMCVLFRLPLSEHTAPDASCRTCSHSSRPVRRSALRPKLLRSLQSEQIVFALQGSTAALGAKLRRVPRCDRARPSKENHSHAVSIVAIDFKSPCRLKGNWRCFLAIPLQRSLSDLRQKQRAEQSLKRHLTS